MRPSKEERGRLRALEREATPGPWASREDGDNDGRRTRLDGPTGDYIASPIGADDAHLIAAARNALVPLLDALDAVERDLAALRREVAERDRVGEEVMRHFLDAPPEDPALANRCPVCDAPPGAGCITAPYSLGTRRPLRKHHRARGS